MFQGTVENGAELQIVVHPGKPLRGSHKQENILLSANAGIEICSGECINEFRPRRVVGLTVASQKSGITSRIIPHS